MYDEATNGLPELAGAVGLGGTCGRRTEAVLLVALRVAAPAVRAVRSADRANMVSVSWLGARAEWINGVVGGGDVGGVGWNHFFNAKLGSLSQQERARCDWPPTTPPPNA